MMNNEYLATEGHHDKDSCHKQMQIFLQFHEKAVREMKEREQKGRIVLMCMKCRTGNPCMRICDCCLRSVGM